jgi:hypothetical protein
MVCEAFVDATQQAGIHGSSDVLRREIAAMKVTVSNTESEWQRRCESEGYVVDPSELLAVVRERIAEARRMLNALDARFPRA